MARMIDTQILIEEIQSSLDIPSHSEHDKGFDDGLDYVLDIIDTYSTLTQPNEWVNVEERLPEEGESVLCIVNGKPRKNITLCEAYQLGVWCKEDGWLIDEYPEWRDVEVLWWMPLPDAPEGEK